MPSNKNASFRYQVIDKCLSDFSRRYYFNDLLNTVNRALEEQGLSNISRRQLYDDFNFMKSAVGYNAPIIAIADGRKKYHRYEEKDFSITKAPLSPSEMKQLGSALEVLSRFDGAPGFDWVAETKGVLRDQFGLDQDKKVMSFEANIDYTGSKHITALFNAIVNERVLKLKYQPFSGDEINFEFHPAYLKQYNGRWFVFGLNADLQVETWNLALDRILSMEELDAEYQRSNTDWEDHFFDIVGVTHKDVPVENVRLIFSAEQKPYAQTKPIHPTQKVSELPSGQLEVRLQLKPNYELETMLMSFGETVEIIEPESLRLRVGLRLKQAASFYS